MVNDVNKLLEKVGYNPEEEELKKHNTNIMNSFVWNEKDVIKIKSFPMDYKDDLFFYGLMIPKNIDNIVKGQNIGRKQINSPCLINSERKILEYNARTKEDLGIDFGDIPNMLPKRWKIEYIRRFLDGESEKVDVVDLFESIRLQYEKYLAIRNDTWYKIHAVWDIGTYLYQIFEAYPFLELRGIAGTAKTKAMTISSYLSFNGGQIMVNPSESTLFRETEEVRGTKYFDEAEKLWTYNKSTNQYEGDVRTELINASYTKEAKVPRQEKIGNRFVTKWYSPYSPTQVSSINGLFGATETRAITRITTKSSNKDNRGELEPSEERTHPIWDEIRDKLYRFGLENWKEIKLAYNNFPKNIGLKRRDYQIWKPILTIAEFIGEELYLEILEFAKELTLRRLDDLIIEGSMDYLCLKSLKLTIEKTKSGKMFVDDIKNNYCILKGVDISTTNIYLNRTISSKLDALGFKELRSRDTLGSFFAVGKDVFNEIVIPICPELEIKSEDIN